MKKFFLFFAVFAVISCSKDPIIYTLKTSANPSEGGNVSPSGGSYEEGESVTITATPNSNYVFQNWSGATGSNKTTTVIMNSDKSITANFTKKKFSLSTSTEGEGSVTQKVIKTGSATDYTIGSVIELTATPSAEWLFVEWKGDVTGTENPVEITIDAAKSVTAVFVKKKYPLTVEVEGEGSVAEKIIKAGATTDYNSGTIVELTASTDKEGWEFKEWSGDLTGNTNPIEITIDAAKTVKAVFVKKPVAYLDDNGITIKANSWAEVGDTVEIGGVTYTIVDSVTLKNMISNQQDVSKVVTSKITGFTYLFYQNNSFNDDISSWDTSNATNMNHMFKEAISFKSDISKWDVSNVTDMGQMFWGASSFNQDIGSWNVSKVNNFYGMFRDASSFDKNIGSWNTSSGTDMREMFYRTIFNQDIGDWDVSNVTDMKYIFSLAEEFNQDIGNWDVSNVTDMEYMFRGALKFNQNLSTWDVSNVTNMKNMFDNALDFNGDIKTWNVSNVVDTSWMFSNTNSFNQDIGDWNVTSVVNMYGMFANADGFNQDIGDWDVSNVTNMKSMFSLTDLFNQDLSGWCVSNIGSEPTSFSSSSLANSNKPLWGKCPINLDDVSVTWNSTGISSTTINGVTTTRYSVTTQINNNWKLPIEVTKVSVSLPNGASGTSDDADGEVASGSAKAITWSWNTEQTAVITWTFKYEGVEYNKSYSWKLYNGQADIIDGPNDEDYSKLKISTRK